VVGALAPRLMMRGRRRRPVGVATKSSFTAANATATEAGQEDGPKTVRREGPTIRRNEMCPCGSGKKYKKCCGK
jgi:preprotein translocase subunit SecA